VVRKIRLFAFGGNEVAPVGLTDENGKAIIPDIPMQWQKTAATCKEIADIIAANPKDDYIITHGNGPQVGNILLRAEYSHKILHTLPLDICGADTQGAMGYMLAILGNELRKRGIEKVVAETVTQVVVKKDDPDFQDPTKFIGPPYSKEEAMERKEKYGWVVKLHSKDDRGKEIWRRVVPSPVPVDIVEIEAVEAALKQGIIPISVGGGGIPVVQVEPEISDGQEVYKCNYGITYTRPRAEGQPKAKIYTGVEAVIDKDYATSLLGRLLMQRAKEKGEEVEVTFTIFTAEDGAKLNFQKPDQKDLRRLTLSEAKELYNRKPCPFPPGSMGPKIKAVIDFLEAGGKEAHISLTKLFVKTLKGEAGTTVVPD
jgi:carbamate kinase